MAKHVVLEKSFINNTLCNEGDIVEWDGPVASNLKPVDGDAKPVSRNAEDLARQHLAAAGVDSGQLDEIRQEQEAEKAKAAAEAGVKLAAEREAIAAAALKAAQQQAGDAEHMV